MKDTTLIILGILALAIGSMFLGTDVAEKIITLTIGGFLGFITKGVVDNRGE